MIRKYAATEQVDLLQSIVTDIHYQRQSFAGPTHSGASFSGGMAFGKFYLIEPGEGDDTFLLRVFDCEEATGWVPWALYLLEIPNRTLYSFEGPPSGLRIAAKSAPAGGVWVTSSEEEARALTLGLKAVQRSLAISPQG